jgi:hypothetical protein
MRLGEPTLYVQRVAPEIDAVPDFCNSVTERQFRAVPQIIRGSVMRETLDMCVYICIHTYIHIHLYICVCVCVCVCVEYVRVCKRSLTRETLNRGMALLNQMTAHKYHIYIYFVYITGSVTLETLNRGVALLNQITADKYQLLALDLRYANDSSRSLLPVYKISLPL